MRDDNVTGHMEMERSRNLNESSKALENRREDKKAFKKFILLLLLCSFAGGVVGFFSAGTMGKQGAAVELFLPVLRAVGLYGNFIVSTALVIGISVLMRQSRRSFSGWDGEDEDVIARVEMRLGYGMAASSVNMVVCYFIFGAGVYVLDFPDLGPDTSKVRIAATLLGLIYAMAVTIWFQKELVNLMKEINPEKNGSVYDTGFQKKWLESCDESERLQIYKACYQSHKMVTYTCLGLWVICVIGIMLWDFGMLPMTMVIVIWLVSGVSYEAECIRMSKHPADLMK